jgi:hypothetical protein
MNRKRPLYRRGGLLALAAAALFAVASLAGAAPVALVTDVVGDVRHGREPLKLLVELDAGRELSLAADATVVVFYVGDGSEWVLKGPGRYRLAGKGPEAQGGAPAAQKRPGPPAFRDIKLRPDRVRQAAVILRGRNLTLKSPVNNDVVVTRDVRLTWALDNARDTEFEVELVDSTGKRVLKEKTPGFEFVLPDDARLEPGQRYTWAVMAREKGLPQPLYAIGEFSVADPATRRRIENARPKADAPFSERVLFVALLEDVGAKGAAEEQRRTLAAERPVGWATAK